MISKTVKPFPNQKAWTLSRAKKQMIQNVTDYQSRITTIMCEATSQNELNTVYIHLNLLNKDSAVKSTLLSLWLPPCGSDPHHGEVLWETGSPVHNKTTSLPAWTPTSKLSKQRAPPRMPYILPFTHSAIPTGCLSTRFRLRSSFAQPSIIWQPPPAEFWVWHGVALPDS